MLKVVFLTIGLVAVALLLLCVRVIIKKDGRFSMQHIGQSKAMRNQGIDCANTQDRDAQSENPNRIDVNKL